ncbi:MAG: serine/threonine protein phosphatase [Proteobacteria bacterium]|nr:serine/threonine protein phosphatase [Pseudomonadota bacterium]
MESREKKPGKIFAVGDIHGCYEKLVTLMNRLPFDLHSDTLIFLGDFINRGSQSREVIEYLLDLKKKCKNIVFLKGNHEHALLQYAQTKDQEYLRLLRSMDVEPTLKSYFDAKFQSLSDLGFLPPAHLDFLNGLLTYYKTDDYLFIHAGVIPGENPDECSLDRLLSVRDTFLKGERQTEQTVVFGHTTFEMPFVAPGMIGIDTGAVYGNMLTAVLLPELRFFHA